MSFGYIWAYHIFVIENRDASEERAYQIMWFISY